MREGAAGSRATGPLRGGPGSGAGGPGLLDKDRQRLRPYKEGARGASGIRSGAQEEGTEARGHQRRRVPILRECDRLQGGVRTASPAQPQTLSGLTPRQAHSPLLGSSRAGRWGSRKEGRHQQDRVRGPGNAASSHPRRPEAEMQGQCFSSLIPRSPLLNGWSLSLPSLSFSSGSLSPFQPPHPGVSLSPSPAPPACLPRPRLCKGPENTQRELCCQTKSIRSRDRPAQLFPIPSALAGSRSRAGSPHAPPFWEVGANTGPRLPRQLNGWPEISHHCVGPQQGTSRSPGQNKASVQSQGPKAQRAELWAGNRAARQRPRGETRLPPAHPHVDAGPCSLPHSPCTHSSTHLYVHTHVCACTVCAHLEGI